MRGLFGWLVEQSTRMVELKCAIMEFGALCVEMTGAYRMPL